MPRVGLAWNPAGLTEAVGHYALGRIGTLRVEGAWEAATAKAGDATWRFEARGRSVVVTTTEAAGRAVGEYNDRTRVLRWDSRELDLRRALVDDDPPSPTTRRSLYSLELTAATGGSTRSTSSSTTQRRQSPASYS
jgi:hypothetical protein